jgi:hypothetical protein
MTDRNHNLKRRHQSWFLQINIPPDLRHAFLSANGKPRERIIESCTPATWSRPASSVIYGSANGAPGSPRLGPASRCQPRTSLRRSSVGTTVLGTT